MRNPLRALFLIGASCALFGVCSVMAFGLNFSGTAEFTTRPQLEVRGQYTYLVLTNEKHSCELLWAMDPKVEFFPVTLDTNRVYLFTVAERQRIFTLPQRPDRIISVPDLRRIRQDGKTIYDIEVCEVHKTRMEPREVQIVYGLFRRGPDEPSDDIEQRLFPHCNEYSLGGCTGMGEKTERVYVCADCKKAYDKWKAENKKSR
jgi:hypothetical protein